jgi:hypothetical protein
MAVKSKTLNTIIELDSRAERKIVASEKKPFNVARLDLMKNGEAIFSYYNSLWKKKS